MILISILYQNASTSRILEPSLHGLISSILKYIRSSVFELCSHGDLDYIELKIKGKFVTSSKVKNFQNPSSYILERINENYDEIYIGYHNALKI